MPVPNGGARKHSKTFTGCWTCRSRKVKCDEARPTCVQCRSKNLACEGYGVRLQWVTSASSSSGSGAGAGSGAGQGGSDGDGQPRAKTQRSQIAAEHNVRPLGSSEIDHILDSIDAYESGAGSNSVSGSGPGPAVRRATAADEDHLFIHHFGVFDPGLPFMEASPLLSVSVVPPDAETSTPSISSDVTEPSFGGVQDSQSDIEVNQQPQQQRQQQHAHLDRPAPQDSISALLESVDPALYLSDDDAHLHNDFSSTFGLSTPTNSWFGHIDLSHDLIEPDPEPQEHHDHHDLQDQHSLHSQHSSEVVLPQHCHWHSPNGTIIRNPSPATLPEQEQFLMYHYSHRAVNLFCVIDNRKSPWKTIHLPRALQSIGQLSIAGASSAIRDALRNALLSISAFCLSNDNKSRRCDDEAARWMRKATLLRGQAIELLKDAVKNDLNDKSVPKYKEFLATMLSMISINVMSGDISTCGMHLDGAYRFMVQARTWKTKFSPKAVALHRIYFYLRAIYESTALDQEENDLASLPPGFQTSSSPANSESVDTSGRQMRRLTWPDSDAPAAATTEPSTQMSTYECIYGVSQNLLVLFFKTTRLVREVVSLREKQGRSATLPPDLAARCEALEQTIMDWSVDLELEGCRRSIHGGRDSFGRNNTNNSNEGNAENGSSYDIIRMTTHAFHNALIIYFAQHIRLMGYRYLQSYVQTVLESIEAIEEMKAEARILAAPLYWPAFIAASEAFNEGLQARFRRWYDQVEMYGIEGNRSGIRVLNEVWKRGPVTGGDITSRWRMVVNETRAHLMLS